MHLIPSDPDVETIISRIRQNEIKLQPDFQRGEVWSDVKKRRLIDSILRSWHVPPIHVVDVPNGIPEVLDGQQRLVAIRDFADGAIKVDGSVEPHDPEIAKLDGLTYLQLPPEWRRRFNRFGVRFFNITDYSADEPAELFFRLNQPVALTSSEQRNAFFGPARSQVKELVGVLAAQGVDRTFLGFSNSRMAYDDVLARFCSQLQGGSLKTRVTAGTLATLYRSKTGFPPSVVERAHAALTVFGAARPAVTVDVRFNKATLFSWLWFTAASREVLNEPLPADLLGSYLTFFEDFRAGRRDVHESLPIDGTRLSPAQARALIATYDDRSSSRVLDVTSVLARDAIIWVFFAAFAKTLGLRSLPDRLRAQVAQTLAASPEDSDGFVTALVNSGWDTRL